MNVKWPDPMPERGRLSEQEMHAAWSTGYCSVADPKFSCQQTLHISLFFDGTNNNDDKDNTEWRDSITRSHTNVARLFNAALDDTGRGIFKFYIPGVGTPFPKIGEHTYSQDGKALAKGFNQRCVWAYIQVLNAVYNSIVSDKTRTLIPINPDAKDLSHAGAYGDMQGFERHVHRLGIAHRQALEESRWPNTVKQIWINVIGFSRGAAAARAFVHKLVNEWAPGGKLGSATGKYALPYQVNFMGLFDTVASVGLPDSFRAALNLETLDGHSHFASNGALAIPESVRACVHAFSIHEQRMSFPLDSIRQGSSYTSGEVRREIAYPGVHSDVGGGYGPGAQGKGCNSAGQGEDARKLSQITLHDMYIAALRHGVPLMKADALAKNEDLARDFELHADTIAAFNAWLKTTSWIDRLEDAMRFGMSQILSWRALRAQVAEENYIVKQRFFEWAREDALTPRKVTEALKKAKQDDPRLREVNARLNRAKGKKLQAETSTSYPENMPAVDAAQQEIDDAALAIRTRTEELCAEVAYPDHASGTRPKAVRPGEGPGDIGTNDKTDLRQGAEEMRLLLAYLHPERREALQITHQVVHEPRQQSYPANMNPAKTLAVRREQPHSDSPCMSLVDIGAIKLHAGRTSLAQTYNANDDVMSKPVETVIPFLKQHTSPQAYETLPKEATHLFDHYVHDSRCWFRVPYFHEYAPGGYGWPRVVFVGKSNRLPWLASDPLAVVLNMFDEPKAAAA